MHVAPRLEVLAGLLAAELSQPLADPFAAEVLAVPGDGVRSWLMDQLSRRLGCGPSPEPSPFGEPAGIVANVDVVFPATVVMRALANDPELEGVISAWSVGALTWAVHDVLQSHGPEWGIEGGVQRARGLADLFDRYGMHRVEMVRAWEAGRDVDAMGRALPPSVRWQPQLWRALIERIGPLSGPAAMAEATNRLRLGRISPDLPERVLIFGLSSLPIPHLRVLLALSTQIDVSLFIPTWSLPVWKAVREVASGSRQTWPIERSLDPTAGVTHHGLASAWARTAREAQLLLASVVTEEPEARITEHAEAPQPVSAGPVTLLQRIQTDLRTDTPAPGVIRSTAAAVSRAVHEPADVSLTWHRCHGPGRQAEVLRDLVRGLLEERDPEGRHRYQPRDIAVLCADPHLSAPLIAAAFSADQAASKYEIPLRLADRSLRQESPLFTTVAALLDLLDGRFRSGDLLGFAALEPVRARYGWDLADLGRLNTWVAETGVRWGLDEHHQVAFGLPEKLGVHTWRDGLDQLLLGAVMADRRLAASELPVGVSDTPLADLAHPGIEGDLVDLVGALADLLARLGAADAAFAAVTSPSAWCGVLVDAVREMCALPDEQAWQWRKFDDLISAIIEECAHASAQAPITASEMAEEFRARLEGSAGRVRFGTGAVTVSSLTAQRGVPHRVVVIHGLDGDLSGGSARAEDLIAAQPCVGDRDARSELRAQLLDAVLAAQERLIIIDTGHSITTNEELPPAVPLAELADLVDATVCSADAEGPPVSELITLHHPRHGWGSRNFVSGAMIPGGPWGFEEVDLHAAQARAARPAIAVPGGHWPVLGPGVSLARSGGRAAPVIALADVERSVSLPLATYFQSRLGVVLPRAVEESEDLIAVRMGGLDSWALRNHLLEERLRRGSQWSPADQERWGRVQVRRGQVPPLIFGEAVIAEADAAVEGLVQVAFADRPDVCDLPVQRRDLVIDLDVEGWGALRLEGTVGEIRGSRLVEIHPGKVRAEHLLRGWLRVLMLVCAEPDVEWELRIAGVDVPSKGSPKPAAMSWTPADLESCRRALASAVECHLIALRSPVIAPAGTTFALATDGESAAGEQWEGSEFMTGDRMKPWVRFGFGRLDFTDLMAIAPTEFESGPAWSAADSRIGRWADRIWGEMAITLQPVDGVSVPEDSWLTKWVRPIWESSDE